MGIGQQQPIRDTVDEVCTDVSRIIYAIFSENQNDNTLELLRLKLDVQKTVGNFNKFVKVLRRYATGKLIDMFIEQLIEKYTTEEQRKAFIKEVCETVLDSLPTFNIEERLYRILSKKYDTEEYRNIFLRLAAEQGNLNAVKYFVEKGGDISAQDEMGYTPLHLAAKQGNLDIVKYLVEKGSDVDVYQGGWGYSTPLHLAAANGHLDTVKYLMGKGANPDAIDGDGKTPLQRANEKGLSDIVEYLAERVQQVTTEVPQVTERQQATDGQQATEVPQVTEGLQATTEAQRFTEGQQVTTEAQRVTEGQQVTTDGQQTTEVPQVTERQQVTEVPQITERQQTMEGQQVTTEVPQTTEGQQVTEDYSNTSLHLAAEQGNLSAEGYFVAKGKDEKSDISLDEGSGYVDIVGYFTEKGQQVTEAS